MASPDYELRVIGAPRAPLRDLYYRLLTLSWPATLAVIAVGYLAVNALFALVFLAVGGVDHARPGSFADAFFFSIQTMGTIGYGGMTPASPGANVVVAAESVTSLVVTALVTGLIFSKFSRPTARLMFTREVSVAAVEGKPTLSFRVGNQRSNRIVEAHVRLAVVRTTKTSEGKTFYRMVDLSLVRERILSLQRSWTVSHVIDEASPIFGETKASLAEKDAEFLVTIVGIDDLWMQSVHASHRYTSDQIAWGQRHVDVLSEEGNVVTLDLRKFHDLEPAG